MTLPSAEDLQAWFDQEPSQTVLGVAWIGQDPRDPGLEVPTFCYFPTAPTARMSAIARAAGLSLMADGQIPTHRLGVGMRIAAHTAALVVLGQRPFEPIPLDESWTQDVAGYRHALVIVSDRPLNLDPSQASYDLPAYSSWAAITPMAFA